MTPEAKARLQIDAKLEQAGWVVQDGRLASIHEPEPALRHGLTQPAG